MTTTSNNNIDVEGGEIPTVVGGTETQVDPTIEVEKPKSPPPQSSGTGSNKDSNNNNGMLKWYILGGAVALIILIFAIVFPVTYCRVGEEETSPSAATTTTATTKSSAKTATNGAENEEEPAFKIIPTGEGGPFNSTLGMFNTDITKPYQSVEELKEDLEQAAWFLLNQVIKRNTGDQNQNSHYYGGGGWGGRPVMDSAEMTVEADMDMAAPAPPPGAQASKGSAPAVPDSLTDFGTNNQEDDVEEGDIVVSDGELVYAAYGDYVVIWNARKGEMVAKVKMPDPKDMLQEDGQTDSSSEEKRSDYYYPYYSKPRIKNMVLEDDRLLVVLEGYGEVMRQKLGIIMPIFQDYSMTHLRLYDTADLANGLDKVIGTADINGRFGEVRAVNGNAHVMTISDVNAYNSLERPFNRQNFPWWTTDEQYIKHVYQTAKDHAIPYFIDKLIGELVPDGKTVPNLARISLWQTEKSGTDLEGMTYSDGVLSSIAQVHSFDMGSNSETLDIKSAGAFLPSSWAKFYGAPEAVVIAGQGWNYIRESQTSVQTTYFLTFKLDGASASPHAVGKVDGYLLNNHAIDIVDNVLRIATSIRTSWRIQPIVIMEEDGDVEATDTEATKEDAAEVEIVQEPSSTQNYIIMLDMPDMDSDATGVMEELGRLRLGKPNELFTAIRFFDNIAYAVTFERKDPLYVLDLNNPREPVILGELDITGFSSYLHSMNADNTLILAIGQEADEDGNILGVQVTVFDVRDPSNPLPAVRHTIEESRDTYSSSRSLDDFKATRYAGERLIIPMDMWGYNNQESFHGFITYFVNATTIEPECRIPHVSIEDQQVEDDLVPVVVEAGEGGELVEKEPIVSDNGDIYDNDTCWYCANLQPRSMIFDGNLMTMNNHFIRSNDMNTCARVWSLDIQIKDPNGGCCGSYGYW